MKLKEDKTFIINQSYGEVIGITDSKEILDNTLRKELKRYEYDDEYIEDVIAGNEESETIMVQEANWLSD